jgi:hypothetical protein
MIFGSLRRLGESLKSRVSASDHGQRRIGNWVQIPNGSAAVMDDKGLKKPLPLTRVVRRDQRITPESEDLLTRAHKDLRQE